MSDERLARIEAAIAGLATKADLAELRAEMVTKADLAGVAKNVEIAALGRSLAPLNTEIATLREEMAAQTAMIIRLDNTIAGQRGELRANFTLINRALDRVRAVEGRLDAIEDHEA
jgi:predicted  nucleic acid-binding Zn-ribbon protein